MEGQGSLVLADGREFAGVFKNNRIVDPTSPDVSSIVVDATDKATYEAPPAPASAVRVPLAAHDASPTIELELAPELPTVSDETLTAVALKTAGSLRSLVPRGSHSDDPSTPTSAEGSGSTEAILRSGTGTHKPKSPVAPNDNSHGGAVPVKSKECCIIV
jgi:hypothetical protein